MVRFGKDDSERKPRQRSRRPAINTYYRSQSKPSSSPFIKKTSKKPVRKFFLGFIDIIILVLLLLAFGYALALKAEPVIKSDNFSYHPKAVYRAATRAQLGKFTNRNKITFNETAIVRALQKQFPEISAIKVELPLFSEQPVLHLTISRPSLVLNSPGSSLVVDSNGVAVGPPANFGVKDLPVVTDQSGYAAKAGSQVLSADSVAFIETLSAECRRAKVPVASLILPAAPQELQLRTKDAAYYVKFYLGGDALQETGQFLAARRHFSQSHQPPSQYLDVRVSGKIYFK